MLDTGKDYLSDWFNDWRQGWLMAITLIVGFFVGHTRAIILLFPVAVIPSLLGYRLMSEESWVYLIALIGIPNGLGFALSKIKETL